MIVIEAFHHINLPAVNLEKSKEFYTMFLDFELVSESPGKANIVFDSINLFLDEKLTEPLSSHPVFSFIMDIDDFTDALQEIEESSIEIVSGPSEIPGGECVTLKDPSGNLLELFYKE